MKATYSIKPTSAHGHLIKHEQTDSLMGIALEGLDQGCLEEAEIILDLLQRFCEPSADVSLMRAIIAIKRLQWHQAIHILDEVDVATGSSRKHLEVMSFKAYCQMRMEDVSWRQTAQEAWEMGGSPRDLALVANLLKKSPQEVEMQVSLTSSAEVVPLVANENFHQAGMSHVRVS